MTLKFGIEHNNNRHNLVSGVNTRTIIRRQPVTISELESSDHNMVLLNPKYKKSVDTGCVTRLTVRCMGPNEKATFNMALSAVKWEPLFRLDSCADPYSYYQTVICNLMEICFPTKIVTRHTADKPWVTDWFKDVKDGKLT